MQVPATTAPSTFSRVMHSFSRRVTRARRWLTGQSLEVRPANALIKLLPRSLTKRCLFVVGNARSGTTIVENCLNESPQILLMGEANFWLHLERPDFVEHYNQMHAEFRNPRSKDSWIPPAPEGDSSGPATLGRMAQFYAWVGDKVAFGPHGLINGSTYQELFFDYQARYFYDSTYVLLIRKPSEVVYSSKKMFSDGDTEEMIRSWIDTLLLQIDIHCCFPSSHWLFFEDLSVARIQQLATQLNAVLSLPESAIRVDAMQSRLPGDEIHSALAEFSEILVQTNQLYRDFKSTILNPYPRGSANVFIRKIITEAKRIRDDLDRNSRRRKENRTEKCELPTLKVRAS
jgi:hypothetical protein